MSKEVVSYTEARARFAELWDRAIQDRKPVVLQRRGSEDVALIAMSELEGIMETAHLLRSSANAERLLRALERAKSHKTRPKSLQSVIDEVGFGQSHDEGAAEGSLS